MEAAALLQRYLDAGQGSQLPARRNRGQLRDLGVELVALQRAVDDIVASGRQAQLAVRLLVPIANEQQRDVTGSLVVSNLPAELRSGHIEQIESEHDQVRPLVARFLQRLAPRQGRGDGRFAAPQNALLKKKR